MEYYSVIKGIERSKREAEIERALKFVHLELYKSIYGHALSGGMLRRLGIAIAIMGDPEIIILDEPTVGLDPEERQSFIAMVQKIRENKTVLFSTHIVDDLRGNCDKILIMKSGRICFYGTERELCIYNDSSSGDPIKRSLEEGYLYSIRNIT